MNDFHLAIDKGETNAAVFIDTSKAFDTVPHGRLLQKLELNFGLKGVSKDLIGSYLSNRIQSVAVESPSPHHCQ
jgi:hypothetical protein